MIEHINADLDTYKRTLAEKLNFLQQLKATIAKTETEINLLNGAIQACEKIIADSENNGKIE
jgi:septal ring factor EnvC (AmiA/AmiB activator)